MEINRRQLGALGLNNVELKRADIFALPFAANSFDHVCLCFVLEHLSRPLETLAELKRVLKPGGGIIVIESDHGSALVSPDSAAAWRTIQCLIDIQKKMGGDALIGRRLYPLMVQGGFRETKISPRLVYADTSRPEWVEGFTRKTFIAMVQGVKAQAIEKKMISEKEWEEGIEELKRTAGQDGTFCYTFFKGTGIK